MEKQVQFTTPDGVRLRAIFVEADQPRSAVVLCHGINSHKQEYLDMFPEMAKRLKANQISSLRFDFRGHGDSGGKDIDFGVIPQIIDLATAIDWLRQQKSHGDCPLSFVGVSFGAPPGLFWSRTREAFARICLFAPVLSYTSTFIRPETPWGQKNFSPEAYAKASKRGYLLLDDSFKLSIRLIEEMRQLDPIEALLEQQAPVLLLHGTADGLVPCRVSAELKSSSPLLDVRIIDMMDHGLFFAGDDNGITEASKKLFDDLTDDMVRFLNV